ncbi:PaaI family thioesterase [Comamonadaceae bacterium PP-2]
MTSDPRFGVEIPFVSLLGFTLEQFADGASELHYTPVEAHLNSFGVAHGGACMTLLDVAMATAARSVEKDMGAVTIEMKTSFMRPSRGALVAHGKLLHRTATMAFTEARIVDAAGQLCAHATGTFKYVKRLPVGPRSTQGLRPVSTD